ncbi:hypothetical protein [Aeromonas sp. FDAARGOS 1402]|uniref:hypothetical protein n=1 Tax=Aeromonas sp. FDAARGOS 1402 TaxID=2778051 RepID=UPI001C247AC6|nr:hypothetical protein [Aeromonas sp. FDAARGOS 1402]QWZ54703.1 hypothetical protein I6L32_02275 [Aeromonas sp. FDAARGOS 1402]
MSYLQGDGTSLSPFIIHNDIAFEYWLNNHCKRSDIIFYAELVSNVSFKKILPVYNYTWYGILNGNGYEVSGVAHNGDAKLNGVIKNIAFKDCVFGVYSGIGVNTGTLEDVIFHGNNRAFWKSGNGQVNRVLWNPSNNVGGYSNTTIPLPSKLYQLMGPLIPGTGVVDLRSAIDRFDPKYYPELVAKPEIWIFDGASPPRLKRQDTSALTRAYLVKGQVKVGGVAKNRFVRLLSMGDFYRISDGVAAADGTFTLQSGFYSDAVMVATYEPYGEIPTVNKGYVLGDIIHPVTPNGFRYLCTKAGNSGATLPPEPWSTSAALTIGAAIFTPDPVYQPQLHGPIKPVLVDLITGQPV